MITKYSFAALLLRLEYSMVEKFAYLSGIFEIVWLKEISTSKVGFQN